MELTKQLKNKLLSLCLAVSVLFLGICILPSLRAEDANQAANEVVTDPNGLSAPIISDGQTEPTALQLLDDPNVIAEAANEVVTDPNGFSGEEEDVFSPRFSAYLDLMNIFEEIFNPELITDDGLVDYSTLRRKRQDLVRAMATLDELNPAVLMALSKNDRQAEKAFWINTFNLCILDLVIENYPIEPKLYMIFYPDNSIMQISGNWRTKIFFDIQGLEYTLEEIEWNFLLDAYKDPRIIFALSYASQGGAILRNEPYTAEKLNQQLDDQVRDYLQTPQGMRIDKENNVLYLSNLFTMHGHQGMFVESEYADIKKFRDYPADEHAWLNFIWQYLSEENRQYLENASPDIRFIKYDWHLNETH